MSSSHVRSVLQALFVTFLWSTSWVLIKFGLEEIPALTFAGLRYALAFLLLLPLVLRREVGGAVRTLTRRRWWLLATLGLVMYTLTQGAQFLALDRLPAQTTSLVLSFSPVVVALFSLALLAERPAPLQWLGVALFLVGALVFLYPASFPPGQVIGLGIAVLGLLSNAQCNTLDSLGALAGCFEPDLTVLSYRYGMAKPSPEIFALLCERLRVRGIAPAETLLVGNDPLQDIAPAAAAGLRTALFTGHPASLRPGTCGPDFVIGDWPGLRAIIEKEQ